MKLLKSSRNKKGLNDVTAAHFLVFFSAGSWEKDTENWAAVTAWRPFLFREDFNGKKTWYDQKFDTIQIQNWRFFILIVLDVQVIKHV